MVPHLFAWQAGLGPSVSLFLSDVETDAWSAGDVLRVASAVSRMVITQVKDVRMERLIRLFCCVF
jgi:hypothetical protein